MVNRYLRFVILLIPILVLTVSCSGNEIVNRLRLAEELKGTRKFDEALQVYKLIVSNYPNDEKTAVAYFKMGDLYLYTLNENEDALIAYSKVIKRWPLTDTAREAALKKAEVFTTNGDVRDAIAEYEWVVKHFPEYEDKYNLYLQVAEGYLSLHDPYQAAIELEKMFKDQGIDLESVCDEKAHFSWWACFGEKCFFTYNGLKKLDLSDDVFSKALFDLGESHLFLEDFMKAYNYFVILEKKFPKAPFMYDAHLRMIECLEKMNMIDEAMRLHRKLVKLYPDSEVIKKRVEALAKRGDKSERPEGQGFEIKDELKVKGNMKKLYGSTLGSEDAKDDTDLLKKKKAKVKAEVEGLGQKPKTLQGWQVE